MDASLLQMWDMPAPGAAIYDGCYASALSRFLLRIGIIFWTVKSSQVVGLFPPPSLKRCCMMLDDAEVKVCRRLDEIIVAVEWPKADKSIQYISEYTIH